MYNLIKMDLYRLFRSKSTWIMMLVVMAVTFFCMFMTNEDMKAKKIAKEEMEVFLNENMIQEEETDMRAGAYMEGKEINMNFGIYCETKDEWLEGKIKFEEFMETQIRSGIFLVLCSVFVSIFGYADQKRGYIKNIAGQFQNRWVMLLSKFTAVGVMNLLMFVMLSIAMFVFGNLIFEHNYILGSFWDLMKVLGSQYLLHMGFSSLILAMCVIFQGNAISMTVGILTTCKVSTLIYLGINKLLEYGLHISDFDLNKYTIENNVTTCSIYAQNSEFVKSLLVGVFYIIITSAFASIVMQKRDVK